MKSGVRGVALYFELNQCSLEVAAVHSTVLCVFYKIICCSAGKVHAYSARECPRMGPRNRDEVHLIFKEVSLNFL